MDEKEIVVGFANKMLSKIEMRHNRYVPLGWKTMDIKRLIFLLKNEVKELEEAIIEKDEAKIKGEVIDIANYALFIHETI